MNTVAATLKISDQLKTESSSEVKVIKKMGFKLLLEKILNRLTAKPEMTLSEFENLESRKRTLPTMWRESTFHEGNWR
jgi:hypothetical protein